MGKSLLAEEEQTVRAALTTVEDVERVVLGMDRKDKDREVLCSVIDRTLKSTPPVRPAVAARVLGLTEKTVRHWTKEGVLTLKQATPKRQGLDPERLHEVMHLVRDLREAGKTRGLLDEVYRRLSDASLLDREDLQESLEQMRRGEGEVIRPRPAT
jgi:DNA-binding transcriptional MerR regulator